MVTTALAETGYTVAYPAAWTQYRLHEQTVIVEHSADHELTRPPTGLRLMFERIEMRYLVPAHGVAPAVPPQTRANLGTLVDFLAMQHGWGAVIRQEPMELFDAPGLTLEVRAGDSRTMYAVGFATFPAGGHSGYALSLEIPAGADQRNKTLNWDALVQNISPAAVSNTRSIQVYAR